MGGSIIVNRNDVDIENLEDIGISLIGQIGLIGKSGFVELRRDK